MLENILRTPVILNPPTRGICNDYETTDKSSSEHQNYVIAREHKSSTVKQKFSEVRNETRAEARKNKKNKTR